MQPTKLGRGARAQAGAPKKLVIKPLKPRHLPDDFEAVSWARLREAVQAVQGKRPVSCSLEELYRAVEDMCLHKLSSKLYALLQQECDAHTAAQLQALAGKTAVGALAFLEHSGRVWQDYCDQLLLIRQIFLYLDRTYVLSSSGVRSLFDMGLQLFRTRLDQHPEVGRKTVEGLLQLIEAERSGETVDRHLAKHLLTMLGNLGLYSDAFQRPFLERTAQYYQQEGERLMQELEVPAYLAHVERRLGEEYGRCGAYLDGATRKPLVAVVESCLLVGHLAVERNLRAHAVHCTHAGTVLDRGFGPMLADTRLEDLARLYSLSSRISALDALRAAFKANVRSVGSAIVMDEAKDADMVQSLLDLKARMDTVLERCFQRNETFANALKEGFEASVNQRANKPAELVAKYIDSVMRGGIKGRSDEEVEATLDAALVLFRYIQGKDVFEAFYKRDLAKRLLLGRSGSVDAEKACISKLKAECGSQFTNKLEGMFKDIELSRDVMASFRGAPVVGTLPAGLELGVHVLTAGFWPTHPAGECRLPEELATAQQTFRDFYLSKHSGRKLAWQPGLGTCVLRATFPSGVKELSVSLYQAVVLSLFNDADELSLADIAAATGLDDRELQRTLLSLACGKERVLSKLPPGKEVGSGDHFRYNDAYSSRLYRVKINTVQLRETPEENKKTNDQVLQDRQYQIDAAVVRIMKTRKTLSHKLLVAELMAQLKFPVSASDLKKRIESLIDREYLERDAADSQIYNYLA